MGKHLDFLVVTQFSILVRAFHFYWAVMNCATDFAVSSGASTVSVLCEVVSDRPPSMFERSETYCPTRFKIFTGDLSKNPAMFAPTTMRSSSPYTANTFTFC